MTRTALFLAALAIALVSLLQAAPAHAQRVFVSGSGSDSNPCTYAQPCRTFAQAFNTVAANGEIDVLDPAGYGTLTITHGVTIEGHGFGGITQTSDHSDAAAIIVNAGISDTITLNGLLIDGGGTGTSGIVINTAGAVQILNCLIRHTGSGITFLPTNTPASLLVSDTVVSDNTEGIYIFQQNGVNQTPITLSRVKLNHTSDIALFAIAGYVMVANSALSNNSTGITAGVGGTVWLSKSTISGNATGVDVSSGTVKSYGNNYINSNSTQDINGTLSSVSTR